jgi:hypothetical protein
MSIIPVNKSLGVDIQDILTGYTTIMTMSQDSGGNKFRRNSTLHLLCSNITNFSLFIRELRMVAAQRKGIEMKMMVGHWA